MPETVLIGGEPVLESSESVRLSCGFDSDSPVAPVACLSSMSREVVGVVEESTNPL